MSSPTRSIAAPLRICGRITGVTGPLLTAQIPLTALGAEVELTSTDGRQFRGVVTAFREEQVTIAPLAGLTGIVSGSVVRSSGHPLTIRIRRTLNGCIIDALGENLAPEEPAALEAAPSQVVALGGSPPSPLSRIPITSQLQTGISAIDGFVPIGYGQRISLSAPAGAGKSTLLGMIVQNASVDHTVISLIGERGREVHEFLEVVRRAGALAHATIVVSTSDEPPIKKLLAAETAFTIGEQLRGQGKRVLLIVDSLTRLARAMRDIGLANGELPVRQGYPASVLVELPKLLERAGNCARGSMSAIFSLLHEEGAGSDFLTHEISSLLDGHLVLDSLLAQQGHYPAIDITRSLSRLTPRLLEARQLKVRGEILKLVVRLYRDRELLLLGGTPDAQMAQAIAHEEEIDRLLIQSTDEVRSSADTWHRMVRLGEKIDSQGKPDR